MAMPAGTAACQPIQDGGADPRWRQQPCSHLLCQSCMDCVDLIFGATRQNSPNDLDARNWFQPVLRITSLLTKLNKA